MHCSFNPSEVAKFFPLIRVLRKLRVVFFCFGFFFSTFSSHLFLSCKFIWLNNLIVAIYYIIIIIICLNLQLSGFILPPSSTSSSSKKSLGLGKRAGVRIFLLPLTDRPSLGRGSGKGSVVGLGPFVSCFR